MAKKAIPPTPNAPKKGGKGAPPPFLKVKSGAPPFPPKKGKKDGDGDGDDGKKPGSNPKKK